MKFVCDRCQTKYSIADERVRGKVLKVKCKTCANVITVREARQPSAGGLPTLSSSGAARPRTGANPAFDVPIETPGVDSERTQLAQSPFGPDPEPFGGLGAFAPPSPVVPARRPTGQMQAVAPADDGVQWYMALDGNRTGPFTRHKLVDKLLPLAKNADVHIWNEKLDGWKPPANVADIAGEIARRRAPPPPPLPGAPRRPTPPPTPALGGLTPAPPAAQPARKPTGPHAPPSAGAHGPGGAASKLPPPGGIHPALAARSADPSSMLETPAPMAHGLPHANGQKTNGVGHAHAPPKPVNSDVMQMLNLPGAQTGSGAPPKLISLTEMMSLGAGTAAAPAPAARSKGTMLILGLLGIVGIVVALVVLNVKKPPRPAPMVLAPPPPAPEPPPVEKPPEQPPPPPIVEPPAPQQRGKQAKGKGKQGKQQQIAGNGKAQPGGPGTTAVNPQPGGGTDADRFRDNHNLNITGGGGTKLPPPDQSAITKVISNNRAGIKVCYQRALTRDNTLTHGKLAVKLSIGLSGRVKHVGLDGPSQFKILLEPCIKEVVQRWVFPQASEEYGTEFPLVFQGNE
jgi:predicted Zn finger-like uncharacterized protein